MTSTSPALRDISRWLLRLQGLTRRSMDNPLSPEALADHARTLAGELPSAAFNDDSLAAVALGAEWFPAVSVIAGAVRSWWADHKPPTRAWPGASAHPRLDDAAQRWVAFWCKRIKEPDCASYGKRAVVLDLIRSRSPEAYDYLLGTDNVAGLVAVGRRMPDTAMARAATVKADWQDRISVRRSVALILAPPADGSQSDPKRLRACLGMAHGLVSMHAPENLDLVRWTPPATPGARAPPQPPPKPSEEKIIEGGILRAE